MLKLLFIHISQIAIAMAICSFAHGENWRCVNKTDAGILIRHCSPLPDSSNQAHTITVQQNTATTSENKTPKPDKAVKQIPPTAANKPIVQNRLNEESSPQIAETEYKHSSQETRQPVTLASCKSSASSSRAVVSTHSTPTNLGERPIQAIADEASLEEGVATFSGAVNFRSGDIQLEADRAAYYAEQQQIDLEGNVVVTNPLANIRGERASINLSDNSSEIFSAEYTISNRHMRGSASRITVDKNRIAHITNGSYTRCQPNHKIWEVYASDITLDSEKGQGKARHAKLNIYDTPVFYLPYARFPVGSQRQSGLLFPKISDTNSGADITLPYYFNIAPNVDSTLSARYKDGHGYLTEGETRWLNTFDSWTVGGSYIDTDESFRDKSRWLVTVDEEGQLGDHISTAIDYTKISDSEFLRDLNTTSLTVNRASKLSQSMNIRYHSLNWDAGARIQRFQNIDPSLNQAKASYEQQPDLWLNYQPAARPSQLSPVIELRHSQFEHEALTEGKRSYGHFGIGLPLHVGAVRMRPSIGYQSQYYDLESDTQKQTLSSGSSYGQLKIDATFEKQSRDSFNSLEPSLVYLYREVTEGRSDIDNLVMFDSNISSFNRYKFSALSQFSGYDIVEETNQLAVALSHHHSRPKNASQASVTLGQILYFQPQQILDNTGSIVDSNSRRSNFVADFSYTTPHWQAVVNTQWDTESNQIQQAYSGLRFRADQQPRRNILNVGYNFRRKNSNFSLLTHDIEQAEFSTVNYFAKQWGLFAKYQYDIQNQRHTESLAGIEFDSCCIQLRLLFRDGVIYDPLDLQNEERDKSILLQMELKGLMGVGRSLQSALNEAIHGYHNEH